MLTLASLSFTPATSSPSYRDPLYLLACVAAELEQLNGSETNSSSQSAPEALARNSVHRDGHLGSQYSNSADGDLEFPRSSMSPTPTLVDLGNHSNASSVGSPVSSRTRKACHRSPKAQKCAKAAKVPRRKEVLARALRIKTVENSPVNDQQLRVLRMVFDQITKYPKDPWIAIIAVIIHRSFAQVKHWFSNERQKNKSGESIDWFNDVGEKIRIRPMAIEYCEDWTDEFFEDVVMVYNFKSRRLLQWVD